MHLGRADGRMDWEEKLLLSFLPSPPFSTPYLRFKSDNKCESNDPTAIPSHIWAQNIPPHAVQ